MEIISPGVQASTNGNHIYNQRRNAQYDNGIEYLLRDTTGPFPNLEQQCTPKTNIAENCEFLKLSIHAD
jgi:hypothetical protein